MWLGNVWNNFAPFAGYMLKDYEPEDRLEVADEELDEVPEDGRGPT